MNTFVKHVERVIQLRIQYHNDEIYRWQHHKLDRCVLFLTTLCNYLELVINMRISPELTTKN